MNLESSRKKNKMILDRKIKPEMPQTLKFNPPGIEKLLLQNGLRVYFIKKDKLPLVRLSLVVNAGSRFDPENKKGLAYLTSMVIDEGAGEYSALQLSDEFDLMGTSFNISTDSDSINLTLQSLTENFEKSFELFSKVLLHPKFESEDFEREKKKLFTRIIQSKDEPEIIADQIFERVIFGRNNGYAFPVMGLENSVPNIELKNCLSHYKNYFLPKNSFLIIAGNIETQELFKLLEKYLIGWKNLNNDRTENQSFPKSTKKIFINHKADSVQTEIRVGHITPPRSMNDYFQRLLLNTILGGQFTSRINLNLREKNGFTYGANSSFRYLKDAAYFQISTSVGKENTVKALNEIEYELNEIKNGVTQKEVDFAKSSITKKFPMHFETYRQIVGSISTQVFFNLPDDYFDKYIDKINSVDKNQIDDAALKFLDENYTIVLVGDKNVIKQQLDELNIEYCETDIEGNVL